MNEDNLTMEVEARRYEQIRSLERQLTKKEVEIKNAKDSVKDLNDEWDAILLVLRAAARNQGELPLFSQEPED